ncbi:MAG: ABC transporter ATP-binding protein [Burkholderiales bacterium]
MARVELDGLQLSLGGQRILDGVTLDVADGECVSLLGPSGCGKTTTLRAIAGFVRSHSGTVRIGGEPVDDRPPHRRNVGLVFQDYALFPHMTVRENVGYGLRMRGRPAKEIDAAVSDALAMVRLEALAHRYPAEMSGGQRQRVALARAIVIRPDVLLLDEPLGALDRKLRDEMQIELKRLQRELGITTIIVTHDQEEALSLSTRVAVMFSGRIAAIAPPTELYQRPGRADVMAFLGRANFLDARRDPAREGWYRVGPGAGFGLAGAGLPETLHVGIRPEHVALRPGDADPDRGECAATVADVIYRGSTAEVVLHAADGTALLADRPSAGLELARGDRVAVHFPAGHLVTFDTRSTT